jgi:uncharacterized membrane protein YGL010W
MGKSQDNTNTLLITRIIVKLLSDMTLEKWINLLLFTLLVCLILFFYNSKNPSLILGLVVALVILLIFILKGLIFVVKWLHDWKKKKAKPKKRAYKKKNK